MIVFRALSALLSYPSEEMRRALPEIADVIRAAPIVAPGERRGLLDLIDELGQGDLLAAEERYVDLFDRGRALSLHLFEHLHGESRDRGEAMVELKQLYEHAGFELSARELPDYLPVVLEYLSCRDLAEARDDAGGLRSYPDDDRPFPGRPAKPLCRRPAGPASSSPARARSMSPRCRRSRSGPKRSTATGPRNLLLPALPVRPTQATGTPAA